MKTYYFLVYRAPRVQPVDIRFDQRCPIGGITVKAWSELEALDNAYDMAHDRFPLKTNQLFVVVGVNIHDREGKAQAKLMEDDWRASLQTFEELMTATYR
jgi:hypothetical protein